MGSKPYHDEAVLRELYKEKWMSLGEIADHFGVAESTIYTWLDKNDIEIHHHGPAEKRFNEQYERDSESGCWIWTGTRHEHGYGQIGVDGKTIGAHRYSYKLHNGEIPDGAFICHKCHNPPCVNPDHLYAGDAETNAQDAVDNGDWPRLTGEKSPGSKLNRETVIEIRNVYREGNSTVSELADSYDVSTGTISRAINGKAWAHVGGPVDVDTHERMGRSGEKNNGTELTEEQVREIKRRLQNGEAQNSISEDYPISHSGVNKIATGNTWTHVTPNE